jgi:hypothetical protein
MDSHWEHDPATSRAATTRLPTIHEPASDARPTVEIKPITVTVTPPPTPYRAIGAYSVKKRATSHSDTTRSAGLPDCEILELLDGGVKFRVNDQICKLSTADARALAEMLLRSAK